MKLSTGELAWNVASKEVVTVKSGRNEFPGWAPGFEGFYEIEREDGSTGLAADYLLHQLDTHPAELTLFEQRQQKRRDIGEREAFSDGA